MYCKSLTSISGGIDELDDTSESDGEFGICGVGSVAIACGVSGVFGTCGIVGVNGEVGTCGVNGEFGTCGIDAGGVDIVPSGRMCFMHSSQTFIPFFSFRQCMQINFLLYGQFCTSHPSFSITFHFSLHNAHFMFLCLWISIVLYLQSIQ